MQDDIVNRVKDYYDQTKEWEWERLVKDGYHRTEFYVTMELLRKYLPKGGKVLDAGGGPGRYSVELCRMGYDTVLYDLSPGNIMLAIEKISSQDKNIEKHMKGFYTGDIRDLGRFRDAEFDAVICLGGPLSHVYDISDIRKSINELQRVTKRGGVVFASVMGRLAVLRTIMKKHSDELLDSRIINNARNGTIHFRGIPTRFFRRNEFVNLMEEAGLITLAVAGCEGLSAGLAEAANQLAENDDKWEAWMKIVMETCTEECVADMAEHILYVGKKI